MRQHVVVCIHTLNPNPETRNIENEQKIKSYKHYKTQTKKENILKHYQKEEMKRKI